MTPPERPVAALQRVVVTGVSALSPAGVGLEAYRAWRRTFPPLAGARHIPGFDPSLAIANPKLLRSMHRSFQVGSAAAVLAMRAAGLPTTASVAAAGIAFERAGIAAALGDLSPLTSDILRVLIAAAPNPPDAPIAWDRFAEVALHELHPFRRLTLLANMAAAHTSLLFGLQGPSYTFTSGGTAGGQTVVQAYWTIAHGRADLMLCQTAECPEQAFSAHPHPELGGAIVLESRSTALARGAAIVGEMNPSLPAAVLANADPAASPALSLLDCVELLAGEVAA